MMQNRLLAVGALGAIATALCCFTPILVVLLGAIGLSALVGYLDYALVAAFAIFVAIMIYALARRKTP
jgi:mercuric ion transport protein